MLRSDSGTYALILQSHTNEVIQVGHWGILNLQLGFYIYIGSAFGPGGLQARVSRHLRMDKRLHWHVDYLREHVTPSEIWVTYEAKHLEHEWAGILLGRTDITPVQSFGCSDCNCYSHLFHSSAEPVSAWIHGSESYDCSGFNKSV